MKNKILHILIFLITIITPNKYCYSQDVIVNGRIATDTIPTGQPFDYNLDIRIPKGYVINWNEIKDTLNKSVEVIGRSEVKEQPIDNSSDILLTQLLTLASFDTGYVEIPSIGINYYKSSKDTSVYTSYTDYMYIYVEPASIDTTMAYKPIKMPIKQNITFKETVPYFGGGIILAGLILLIIYIIKRSKNKKVVEEEDTKPQIPAIITAREKLAQLSTANLWQSGKYKDYYTDLTDIAREYLEGQFDIDAIEMTSDEIIEEVRKIQLDNIIFNKLQNTLTTADLVKFAKATPSPAENENAFNDITSFIEESFTFQQELEKKKAEEAKAKKYDFEEDKNQEMEETK
jgi:hypothetical protein